MKKITLSELILLINQTNDKVYTSSSEIVKNSIIIKHRELDGKETILNNVKDFNNKYNLYIECLHKLETYKNKLSKANSQIIATKGMTILETLNHMNNLKKQLALLDELCAKEPSLKRYFDGNGSNAYYRVEDLNFDIEKYKNEKLRLQSEINNLESCIQQANANNFVEIE
ncbi:hypothetical protein ACOAKC_02395 [Hathewaya histolytica]|uniref:hypothetical protein n=1 Tax=Hathewaya histolytica TaxID=1498 RepID=UPI003B66B5E0